MNNICTATKQDMENVLLEVRKAYRLLWLYHRRVLDTCNEIIDHFNVQFYVSAFKNKPGHIGYNPLKNGAWDMTPMHDMSVLFLNKGSRSNDPSSLPEKGDYLIDLHVIADTGHDDYQTDANPVDFKDIAENKMKLCLYIFVNDETRLKPTN